MPSGRGTVGTAPVRLSFAYSRGERERIVQVDYRKRSGVQRVHNPSAHLRALDRWATVLSSFSGSRSQQDGARPGWRSPPRRIERADTGLLGIEPVLWRGRDVCSRRIGPETVGAQCRPRRQCRWPTSRSPATTSSRGGGCGSAIPLIRPPTTGNRSSPLSARRCRLASRDLDAAADKDLGRPGPVPFGASTGEARQADDRRGARRHLG